MERINDIEIFNGIKYQTLEELKKQGKIVFFKKGSLVLRDKEEENKLYFVISGNYSLYKLSASGERKVIFILGPSDLINEPISKTMTSSVNCEVTLDGYLYVISQNNYIKLLESDSNLSINTINYVSLRIRRLYRQLKNTLGSIRGDKRLAAKLWKLGRDYGVKVDEGVLINLDLSITYLSELLGTKRETLSRQMKILTSENLIIKRDGKIIVPSLKSLENYFKA